MSSPATIKIIVSDPARGLLFYPVRLAIALSKLGIKVTAYTWTTQGQQAGLDNDCQQAGVELQHLAPLAAPGIRGMFQSVVSPGRFEAVDGLITFGPVSAVQMRLLGHVAHRSMCFVESMGSVGRSERAVRLGALMLNFSTTDVFALCELERRRLRQAGVDEKRLRVIHNPVDCDSIERQYAEAREIGRTQVLAAYHLDSASRYVGCFANLLPGKRHDILLRAFSTVAKRDPQVKLVLCGAGPCEADLRTLATTLGLVGRAHFLGRLSNNAATRLMSCMDLMVQVSAGETFGYSLVEPLLLGVPLITTRVGIGLELGEAQLAIIVEQGDVQALASAVINQLQKRPCSAHQSRAKKFIRESFDVSVIAQQLASLLAANSTISAAY